MTTDLRTDLARAVLDRECSQPVEVPSGDGSGLTYYVRCGSRLASDCPSCSRIAVNDWAAIIRSGVYDAPQGYRWYLLTLTAPSFGRVHRVPKDGKPIRCSCGARHTTDDGHLRGLPVDPDTYDYDGAVRWNRDSSRLWNATNQRFRQVMPTSTYAAVREWQARGALHYHVLLRVPAAESLPSDMLRELAASVMVAGHDGDVTEWGDQIDARAIQADGSTARLIWYVTKAIGYLVKSVADGGIKSAAADEHALRLNLAAGSRRMHCPSCRGLELGAVPCRAPAHKRWGAMSHVVSVSRPSKNRPGWSLTGLTRTRQRQQRIDWATEQNRTAKQRAEDSHRRASIAAWANRRTGRTRAPSSVLPHPSGLHPSRHRESDDEPPGGDADPPPF